MGLRGFTTLAETWPKKSAKREVIFEHLMSQYWVPKRDLEQHQATFSPATQSRRCLHAASCCLWLVGKNTPWHLYMTALLQKRTEQRIRPSARECILPLGAIACLPFRNAFLLHARLRYPLVIQHTVAMITACLQTYIYIYHYMLYKNRYPILWFSSSQTVRLPGDNQQI